MLARKYNWEAGVVTDVMCPHRCVVFLNSGEHVFTRASKTRLAFSLGDEVAVAWFGPYRYPPERNGIRRVDSDAVELICKWDRFSSYEARFDFGDRTKVGFLAEKSAREILRGYGLRVDSATRYEDEQLGVDMWVFVRFERRWRWLPFDITFRPFYKGRKGSHHKRKKREKCRERGVFPFFADGDMISSELASDFRGNFVAEMERQVFEFLNLTRSADSFKILSRRSALEKEIVHHSPSYSSSLQLELRRIFRT